MPIIENNTFKFDEQGNLIPVGEVTGTIDQTGSSNGQDGTTGVPGTPATPGIGGGDYNPLDQNKTPDYQKGAQTEQRAGDIPAGGVGVSVVPETNETLAPDGIVPTKPIVDDSPYANGINAAIENYPDTPIRTHIGAYNKWATEKGQAPLDIFQIYDLIQGKDPNKSAAQNAKDEKKAKRKERFEQVGNFLGHLGNFVGTLYGSPNQETLESATSLSKRQQDLRDKTIALRQQTAKDYLAAYNAKLQHDITRQNAERNLELAKVKIDKMMADIENSKRKVEIMDFRAQTDKEFKEASIEIKNKLLEIQADLAAGRITLAEAQTRVANINAQAKKEEAERKKNDDNVTEVTEYERDADGNVKKSTKTKTKATEQKTEKTKVNY